MNQIFKTKAAAVRAANQHSDQEIAQHGQSVSHAILLLDANNTQFQVLPTHEAHAAWKEGKGWALFVKAGATPANWPHKGTKGGRYNRYAYRCA